MNDDQANTLNTHLKSVTQSLEGIAEFVGGKEQRAAAKAAARGRKRASAVPKK